MKLKTRLFFSHFKLCIELKKLYLTGDGQTWILQVEIQNPILYTPRYLDIHSKVTHLARILGNNPATDFSNPFCLVIDENAKKVGKNCHLGVPIHPPWFM